MTRDDTLPDATRIGRTALLVDDLEELTDFYRDVVGLRVRSTNERRTTLGVDGTTLLVLERDEDAPPRRPDQTGLFHTAFEVTSRAALGSALERVRDRWRLDGASDHYVSEALYLTDPEGNGVELYWDRPREEWPRRDDGSVRIGTIPLDLDDVISRADGAARLPSGATVGHVHLEVSSLEAARAFYADALGFAVQTTVQSALFLAAGGYHHHVGLNTWNDRSARAGGRGLAWIELLVPTREALETVRRRLEDAAVRTSDLADGFEVADPDGISFRIRTE